MTRRARFVWLTVVRALFLFTGRHALASEARVLAIDSSAAASYS